jgi:hypothetical protein
MTPLTLTTTLKPGLQVFPHINKNGKLRHQLVIFTEIVGLDVTSELLAVLPGVASVSHNFIEGQSASSLVELFNKMEAGSCAVWNETQRRHDSSSAGKIAIHSAYVITASGKVTCLKEGSLKPYQHFSDLA